MKNQAFSMIRFKRLQTIFLFQTMKKKFFILRATSSSGPARLDYFDNEKKFKTNHPPKKSYELHTFFNINKKVDSKHKFGIAIFLPNECFSVLAENEAEQEDWISKMLEYQNEFLPQDEEPRNHYGISILNFKVIVINVNPKLC
jgi:hypothetical protein